MLPLKLIGKFFNLLELFISSGDDRSNLDLIKKIRFFGQSKKLSKVLINQL